MDGGWKIIDKGNRVTQFTLRPGEGRWCLGKVLRTVPGSAATFLLKAVSKTLETNQVLHKWYPAKNTSDKCDLCKQQCETVAHLALACPVLSDATTAAHDKVRKRFSNALEKGLGREMEGWEFCWETQVGDALPVLRGVTEGYVGGSTTDLGETLGFRGKVGQAAARSYPH